MKPRVARDGAAPAPLTVVDRYEFGPSFGSSTPIGLWFLEGQRIGISDRFGDGLNAVRMNLGFPF